MTSALEERKRTPIHGRSALDTARATDGSRAPAMDGRARDALCKLLSHRNGDSSSLLFYPFQLLPARDMVSESELCFDTYDDDTYFRFPIADLEPILTPTRLIAPSITTLKVSFGGTLALFGYLSLVVHLYR